MEVEWSDRVFGRDHYGMLCGGFAFQNDEKGPLCKVQI